MSLALWLGPAIRDSRKRRALKNPKRDHLVVRKGLGLFFRIIARDSQDSWWVTHKHLDQLVRGPFPTREAAEAGAHLAFMELLEFSKTLK